jgi:hypothetical protein
VIPADVWAEEALYQAVHIADLQQTLSIRHDHCRWIAPYSQICNRESRVAWQGSGWIIGSHPSDRSVYAYFAAESVLHLAVSAALSRWALPWAVRAWEVTSISFEGYTVARNAHLGVAIHL